MTRANTPKQSLCSLNYERKTNHTPDLHRFNVMARANTPNDVFLTVRTSGIHNEDVGNSLR